MNPFRVPLWHSTAYFLRCLREYAATALNRGTVFWNLFAYALLRVRAVTIMVLSAKFK